MVALVKEPVAGVAKARTEAILLTEEEVHEEVIDEPVVPEEPVVHEEPAPSGEPVPDTEECPQCHVVEMMAVMALANTSCQLVDDEEKREECIAWAEALDPEFIDNLDLVTEGVIELGDDNIKLSIEVDKCTSGEKTSVENVKRSLFSFAKSHND